MTDQKTPTYDYFAIEREARRLRAEATRAGMSRFWAWLTKPRGSLTAKGQKTA